MWQVYLENNKSVKWIKNLHFLKHATLDILIYKSRMFLVFVILDSLCKFVIFSGHKSGDKIEKFWSQCLLFLKECQTLMKADKDLQISPMARSRDIFSFSYQFSMENCKLIFLNHCLTTAKIFKIIENWKKIIFWKL